MSYEKQLATLRKEIVGIDVKTASKLLINSGWIMRQTIVDGKPKVVTRDFRMDRVNVVVKNGLVQKVSSIG